MVTSVTSVLYAVCQAPNSGNTSVLPVSVSATPVEDVEADGDEDEPDEEPPPELPQAAASKASGTSAAAAVAMRIFLATGEYSFVYCTFTRAWQGLARGCARWVPGPDFCLAPAPVREE
jgi:hypothetical protein